MIDLNDETFHIYAIKSYNDSKWLMGEINEDLKRLKYIKRLIKKYLVTKVLKERLILNHIIVLSNVFGVEPTVRMLFFKLDSSCYPVLKTFLLFLNYMPDIVRKINGQDIISGTINTDIQVGLILRKL